MPKTNLRTLWNRNKPVLNGWLQIDCPLTAEIMSKQDYDSITIDMQHGIIGYTGSVSMLQSMHSSGVTPIVRVPWLDPSPIMKALDAGAYGIICPMINNRAEAEQFVSYMRYPPLGCRSFGPTRHNIIEKDYFQNANSEVICIAMIETAEAMKNLNEIISTPGLDAVYIGPADLTLGVTNGKLPPGMDREEPLMVKTIKQILEVTKKEGKKACLHCVKPDYAIKAISWGFDLVTLNSDSRLLSSAASDSIKAFREGLGNKRNIDDSDGGGY